MSISVVVCGMDDRARLLWPTFKYAFDKYWPDCPWDKYFITNFEEGPEGFKTLKTGREMSWSSKVDIALSRVKSDIVFWMMEDFWLTGPVITEDLVRFAKAMEEQDIDHISLLCPAYGGDGGKVTPKKELSKPATKIDKKLWYLKADSTYRASVAQSFWRKKTLEEYLGIKDINTPWDFENNISPISTTKKALYLGIVDPYIFPLPNYSNPHLVYKDDVVIKGRWTPAAYEYVEREKLDLNFKIHPNGDWNNT